MTRMFHIDPRLLCKQHLLGEHSEMHEGVGLITSDHAAENPGMVEAQLRGQANAGNIDTSWFIPRHAALAHELKARGGQHNSPLVYDDDLELGLGAIDPDESLGTLIKCESCRPRLLAAIERVPKDDWERIDGGQHIIPPTAWYQDEHPFDATLDAIAREFDSERVVPEPTDPATDAV